jgi:hypothetical protein
MSALIEGSTAFRKLLGARIGKANMDPEIATS